MHNILFFSIVKFLVDKNQPSMVVEDEDGNTPLHLAAKYGRVKVADYLIDAGAEVDARCVCVCVVCLYAIFYHQFSPSTVGIVNCGLQWTVQLTKVMWGSFLSSSKQMLLSMSERNPL